MRRLNARSSFIVLFFGIVLAISIIASAVFLLSPSIPTLSAADASATSEAYTFATAQAYRQATHEAADAASTAQAQATAEAAAESSATSVAYARVTATAAAKATSEAPPTLTAEAKQYEQDQDVANATVQSLAPSATQTFGPSSGTLPHNTNGDSSCSDTDVKLINFEAEARFYNPYPSSPHTWDYGIVLTNPSSNTQYNVDLASRGTYSFGRTATGYSITDSNTSHFADLSATGSNLISVYVLGSTVHLYVNGHFEATEHLDNLSLGDRLLPDTHEILICTGLHDGDMQPGKSTRYDGFTVWKLP